MRVLFICPAPRGSRLGNRVTAERWRRTLASLGHDARIAGEIGARRYDVLVALHAKRSADTVSESRARHPERAIVVALTGTDLYKDLPAGDRKAERSLEIANALVVLHDGAERALPARHRAKAFVVHQSAKGRPGRAARSTSSLDVAVVGHLREEKDPFRAALASRLLPASSRVHVLHAGRALERSFGARAKALARGNPRYTWLGELAPSRARALIAKSHVLVLSSRMEGGANVVSEAIAAGTPVIAARIACTRGIFGARYPGLYPVGSTPGLARLLARFETDAAYRRELTRQTIALRPRFSPAREKDDWRKVLAKVTVRP